MSRCKIAPSVQKHDIFLLIVVRNRLKILRFAEPEPFGAFYQKLDIKIFSMCLKLALLKGFRFIILHRNKKFITLNLVFSVFKL